MMNGWDLSAGWQAVCYGLTVAGLVAAVAGLRPRYRVDRTLREVLGVLATTLASTGVVVISGLLFEATGVEALWRVGAMSLGFGVIAAAVHVWATRTELTLTREVSAAPALAAGVVAVLGLPWAAQGLTRTTGLLWLWPTAVVAVAGLWALGVQRRDVRNIATTLHTLAWGVLGWGTFAAVRALFSGAVDPPSLTGGAPLGLVEVAALTAALAAWAPAALALRRARPGVDPVAALRGGSHALLAVAAAAGALGLGLLANPLLTTTRTAGVPILNTALLAYGLASLALWVTATACGRLDAPHSFSGMRRAARGVAAGLAVLGAAVLIRHLFHRPDLRLSIGLVAAGETVAASARIGFREYGTYALALLGAAAAVVTLAGPRGRKWAGVAAVVGVLIAAGGAGGLANPLRFAETVGSLPVLNAVLWVLLLPAALAGFMGWRLEHTHRALAGTLAGGALLLDLWRPVAAGAASLRGAGSHAGHPRLRRGRVVRLLGRLARSGRGAAGRGRADGPGQPALRIAGGAAAGGGQGVPAGHPPPGRTAAGRQLPRAGPDAHGAGLRVPAVRVWHAGECCRRR